MGRVQYDGKPAELLGEIPLFADCDAAEIEEIAGLTRRQTVDAGTVVVAEGDPGTDFYVVVAGAATVSVAGEPVAELGPGAFFGEMALLDGGERVATVTATGELELLALARDDFNRMLEIAMPTIAPKLLNVVGRRVHEQERREGRGTPFGI